VQTVEGRYGEFTVLVDGREVLTGGALGFLGVLPSVARVRDVVTSSLGDTRENADRDAEARDP
jgi:hypothetical protein